MDVIIKEGPYGFYVEMGDRRMGLVGEGGLNSIDELDLGREDIVD